VACHSVLDGPLGEPAKRFTEDIHGAKGFGCVACHGGDALAAGLEAMDPARGFVGKPDYQQVSQFCGRCHADAEFMKRYNPRLRVDQVAEYAISVHGRRSVELGDTAVATCISCHPAHSIKPPEDPLSSVHPLNVSQTCGACHANAEYMQSYPIATDQKEKYERSIHWEKLSVEGDLGAPTCNDCHGNHGAAPPGVSWVGNVCGQCHSVMADYFAQSRHASIFTMLGVPGCATCHNNHDITEPGDELLGLGEGAVCVRCHKADVGGGIAAVTMRGLIDSLRVRFDSATALLHEAERSGMEVSQAQFELGAAQNELVHARAAVHTFNVDSVTKYAEDGLTIATEAYSLGRDALGELKFRRAGLAVSVTVILALIVGLVLRIRELDRRQSSTHT
jgi:predicted CXXCH cytochrome family protein